MKKFAALALIFAFCLSMMILPTSAATTYKDFNDWNLEESHIEVWFADVVYQGETVGHGILHYSAGSATWPSRDATISTEYQNYNLPRDYGSDNGIDVTVYAYGKGASGVDLDRYSWSDQDNKGGNILGWIEAEARLFDPYPTYMTGYVKVSTPAGSDTAYYRIYG